MKNDDMDDDYEDDYQDDDEIDEHELEVKASGGQKINWRRVEMFKERLRLKQELSDFDDYSC